MTALRTRILAITLLSAFALNVTAQPDPQQIRQALEVLEQAVTQVETQVPTVGRDDAAIEALVEDLGIEETEVVRPGLVRFTLGETALYIARVEGHSLQFHFAAEGAKATAEDMNTWNNQHRFSRAFINPQGVPCLQAEILGSAGLTDKQIRGFLQLYCVSVREFYSALAGLNPPAPAAGE